MPRLSQYVGLALTLTRDVRRLGQEELAERTGVRPSQISRYETGAVIPQLAQLERLLNGLGIGYVEFFYVVSVVERLVRVVERVDRRETPEALAIHAALARLSETADTHLQIAEEIEALLGRGLGQEETRPPAPLPPSARDPGRQ